MAKKFKNIFEWNIIAISYTTLRVITISFIILILGLSIGIYYYFTKEPDDLRSARELLQTINLQMNNVRKVESQYYNPNDAKEVGELYNNAKASFDQEQFSLSIAYSQKAVKILDKMNQEIQIKREPHRNLYAIITHIQGTVNVRKSGELEWLKAEPNVKLAKGDTIRTLSHSQANIQFEDGSKMQLHPNSYMEIGDLFEDKRTRYRASQVLLSEPESKVDFLTESTSSNLTIQTPHADTKIVERRSSGVIDYRNEDSIDVRLYEGEANIISGESDVILQKNKALEINLKADRINIIDLPPPVSLINPSDKKIISLPKDQRLAVQWLDPNNFQNYFLEVSTNPYFTNTIRKAVSNSNQVILTNIEEGNYYWRVYAVNKEGIEGSPSAIFDFRIIGDFDQISQDRPFLTLNNPLIFGPFVIISGTTEKGAIIVADGQRFDVRQDGTFQATLKYEKAGKHNIDVIARNPKNDLETLKSVTVHIII